MIGACCLLGLAVLTGYMDYEDAAQGEPCIIEYSPEMFCEGTTLLADLHDRNAPRIIEVDMEGNIVWEWTLPVGLRPYTNPGMDVEALEDGNILAVLPGYGIIEVSREKEVVWQYREPNISHDADRLPNGNTLVVFGNRDTPDDTHVFELTPDLERVWEWSAGDTYLRERFPRMERQGWTHANSVTRLENGNTLVNLRNQALTVEVNPEGRIVWEFDWNSLYDSTGDRRGFDPHEPEILPDGNLLVCLQWDAPYQVVEIDRDTGEVVWTYWRQGLRTTRDADRLPNGNTLIVGVQQPEQESVIFEITREEGRVVWEMRLRDCPVGQFPGWFYKAERIVTISDATSPSVSKRIK